MKNSFIGIHRTKATGLCLFFVVRNKINLYILKMEKKVITVTSPLLPSLDDFMPYLQDI